MTQRHHPQRLGQARHGGRGAHHAAGAGGGGEAALDLADPLRSDAAGAIGGPIAAAVGAGGEALALERRRQHRAGNELHAGDVSGRRGHQLRRHGLVAAADQHRGVHRLGEQHRLGVERGEVAIVHGAGEQRWLAQGDGGEGERQSAGGEHTAFYRLHQLRHRAVAVVVVAAGIDDADHRPVQHCRRVAHRLGEGPAQVQREIRITVSGGLAGQAVLFLGAHAGMLCCGSDPGNARGQRCGQFGRSLCKPTRRRRLRNAVIAGAAKRSPANDVRLLGKLLPLRSGRLRRCAPGNCFAVLREIASLRSGRLLRCPRNDTINRATGDATPDRQPTVSDTPHRAPTVSVPPLGEPRRQKLHLTHTGLPNHLGQIDQVVDRLEQIPQQPRRRYPEQTGDVVVAVIEHAMRDATR